MDANVETNWAVCDLWLEAKKDRECTYDVIMRRFLSTVVERRSNEYYVSLVWFVALSTQYVMWMCHIFSVACPALQFYSTYHINGTIFNKKVIAKKKVFWFFLQGLSETFFSLTRNKRDTIKNLYWSSFKVVFSLVWVYETLDF